MPEENKPGQNQAPSAPPQTAQGGAPQKKSHAWMWILGGCLMVIMLIIAVVVGLGWWGARKVKKEVEKYKPGLEQMKDEADKWSREADEWEKKSEEFRESLPNPEDMPVPEDYPAGYPETP